MENEQSPLADKVAEILEQLLGMLSLEGSFDIEETDEAVFISIETEDAGRLIGHQGETLTALQQIINQIMYRQVEDSKRVILDVSGWRKNKESDLESRAKGWIEEVLESGKEMALEPMPSWQRRIVHMVVQNTEGVKSESVGEGLDRHLVISVDDQA
jgi:spoIIIJ-associated protein